MALSKLSAWQLWAASVAQVVSVIYFTVRVLKQLLISILCQVFISLASSCSAGGSSHNSSSNDSSELSKYSDTEDEKFSCSKLNLKFNFRLKVYE